MFSMQLTRKYSRFPASRTSAAKEMRNLFNESSLYPSNSCSKFEFVTNLSVFRTETSCVSEQIQINEIVETFEVLLK